MSEQREHPAGWGQDELPPERAERLVQLLAEALALEARAADLVVDGAATDTAATANTAATADTAATKCVKGTRAALERTSPSDLRDLGSPTTAITILNKKRKP